jgi:hypothetical protein
MYTYLGRDNGKSRMNITSIPTPRLDCDQTRVIFESDNFPSVVYEIKDNHMIIYARNCGALSINLDNLSKFIAELEEANEAYAYDVMLKRGKER